MIHDVFIVLTLVGRNVVVTEFDFGVDGCKELAQGRDPSWFEVR